VHGDLVADADLPGAISFEHWFSISGVEVNAPSGAAAIVTLGDSITDGRGSTTDRNDRWPDDLARRLRTALPTRCLAVLNQGIGATRGLSSGERRRPSDRPRGSADLLFRSVAFPLHPREGRRPKIQVCANLTG
jgi:hypothetical protein